jgi:hypothetical protein
MTESTEVTAYIAQGALFPYSITAITQARDAITAMLMSKSSKSEPKYSSTTLRAENIAQTVSFFVFLFVFLLTFHLINSKK